MTTNNTTSSAEKVYVFRGQDRDKLDIYDSVEAFERDGIGGQKYEAFVAGDTGYNAPDFVEFLDSENALEFVRGLDLDPKAAAALKAEIYLAEGRAEEAATHRLQAAAADTDVGFYVARAECANPVTFDRLARTAARILSAEKLFSDPDEDEDEDEDSPAALDPIDVEIFTAPRTGAFIADVTVCIGGPTVWVRYESRSGKAVIHAHWGRDELEVEVTEWQPADDLEAYAEANAAY